MMDITRRLFGAPIGKRSILVLPKASIRTGIVFAILVLALGLRLYGMEWDRGYAYTPHPDERAILSKVTDLSPPTFAQFGQLLNAEESPWNPRWFNYGSLPLYLLKGVQLIYSVGPGEGFSDLRPVGRVISAIADTTTVLMVFFIGRRIYGYRVGVLAMALTALAVIHIQLSHFFTVDTLLTLFTVTAMYFMCRVAKEGRLKHSILAGACIGLSLGTKASVLPIFAAFVMAHLMYLFWMNGLSSSKTDSFSHRRSPAVKGLVTGLLVSVGVLFIVQPYTFLDWSRFYSNVVEQSEMVRRIVDYPYTRQYIDTTSYWYHFRQLATWGLGWPLGIVAWAGLIYVSIRGMRLKLGFGYLILGWGLPAAILFLSTSMFAILLASLIAVASLLITLPLRSRESQMDVLLMSWVIPLFLITGTFQVKFLRYLIPITPFLILFGSRMLLALWAKATIWQPTLRPWLIAGLILLIGSTAFYAISYMSVYHEPHTAVRTSQWINKNVSEDSIILKEGPWEEGFPNMGRYHIQELPMYEPDSPFKLNLLADKLAQGDFLLFFSNRMYGTIPRLPERYPISTAYYRLLFSGHLGYELVNVETAYPRLAGVGFIDETFKRPGLSDPTSRAFTTKFPPVTLNLGYADESFSVYDHPKVLVFRNAQRYDSETILKTIDGAIPVSALPEHMTGNKAIGLMLKPEDRNVLQANGTWSDIIYPESWTNRFSVLSWLILVQVIALLATPITFIVFRPLPDRGYLFSKILGLMGVGILVWLLSSLHWMAFSRASIGVAILILALVSALVIARRRNEIITFIKERWSLLLIGEVIFLIAFFSFVLLRMANPDLWHPFRGGEKPMEMAYLNAVLRSSYMPPYDPWFGGGYLNYYYWGQFMVATLIKATGIRPEVAFNLAVPLFFSLTVSGAFAVVFNLAESTRRRLQKSGLKPASLSITETQQKGTKIQIQNAPMTFAERLKIPLVPWSPVLAGIGGALFVAVLGNLDGAIQVVHGIRRAMFSSLPFGEFDFWRSSRMMPTDVQGITEFPFFTFLFADLHAHLMALPVTILVLGLSLAVILASANKSVNRVKNMPDEFIRLAVLGIAVGSLRLINAWDFPTYLIIGIISVILAEYYSHGGLGLTAMSKAAFKSFFVFAIGYLIFLPFHLNYETFFATLEITTDTTILWRFLSINGLFVFVIGSFFIHESKDWIVRAWQNMKNKFVSTMDAISNDDDRALEKGESRIHAVKILILVLVAVLGGFILNTVFSSDSVGSTIPFAALILAMTIVLGIIWLTSIRADGPHLAFIAVLAGVSLMLVIGLDIFRVTGDIERMNSVFKFYLQIWVLLALASAYLLWHIAHNNRFFTLNLAWWKKIWIVTLGILIISASIYPILGTKDRLRDRFNDQILPLTLDGTAYVEGSIYHDENGDIDLTADFEGIQWLRENVSGSPIILEGHTPTYRWGSRVSIYTGLPTVIGWRWHQEQQRWNYRWAISQRIADVDKIYRTTKSSLALDLMKSYGVKYVYLGQVERLYYPGEGLKKFDGDLASDLEVVFQSDEVTIYRLREEGL